MASTSPQKRKLETYITQGNAMKKLLVSTNSHGKHNQKIKGLNSKINKAQKSLAKFN